MSVHQTRLKWRGVGPLDRRAVVAIGIASVVVLGEWNGLVRGAIGRPLLAFVLDVALAVILAYAYLTWRQTPQRPPVVAIDVAILGYALMSALWIAHPNVPNMTVGLEGFRKAGFPIIAYVIVRAAALSDVGLIARIVAIGSTAAFLWGIRQFFFPLPLDFAIVSSSGISSDTFMQAGHLRSFSPTSGPFHLGMLAGVSGIAGLILAWRSSRRWIIPAAIALVALALTLARAIWIGTAIGMAATLLPALDMTRARRLMGRSDPRPGRRSVAALVGLVILGLGLVAFVLPASMGADRWMGLLRSIIDPLNDRNLQLRFGYWAQFVDAIRANPLVGYGTSAAADGFGSIYAITGARYFYPHSIYFKPFLELGILGFALFVTALAGIAVCAWHGARTHTASGAIGLGTVVLVLVSGLTGPMLDAYPFNVLFWSVAGVCVNVAILTGVRSSFLRQLPGDGRRRIRFSDGERGDSTA